ncbi:MAG: class I SAM-dependent methyltransferase [Candidatus Neptunochlamydia sp.]|nr:class I SAM-dependent methyltransferase [Candidatus Neptunochlamydia sp.]
MFLTFAHEEWKKHLRPSDRVIDATSGNGHDTLVLSKLNLSHLYVFDIQEKALQATQNRLGFQKNISYHLGCHSLFSGVEAPIDLIVYNLGYLPGGDKSLTTQSATTLKSLEKGLNLLSPRGLISITLYPGHPEGEREAKALLAHVATFSPKNFQYSHHRVVNRPKAPSLLLIKKIF